MNTDYAVVVIRTCTGDAQELTYDKSTRARQVASTIGMCATSKKPVGHFQFPDDPDGWFDGLPADSHIMEVLVTKKDDALLQSRDFICEHVEAWS